MHLQRLALTSARQPSGLGRNHKYLFASSCTCDGAEPAVTPADRLPQDYLQRVKAIHEEGGFGSIGYAPIHVLLAHRLSAYCPHLAKSGKVVATDVHPSIHANLSTAIIFHCNATVISSMASVALVHHQAPCSVWRLRWVPACNLPLLYASRFRHKEEGSPCSLA